jgi:hypothetical protein
MKNAIKPTLLFLGIFSMQYVWATSKFSPDKVIEGLPFQHTCFYGITIVEDLNDCLNTTCAYCLIPSISLGNNPSICKGTATANLPFTITGGAPNLYKADFDADANTAGLMDVDYSTLPSGSITLPVPIATNPGQYNGSLRVKESSSGAESDWVMFNLTVKNTPTASIAIAENSGVSPTDNTVCSGAEVTLTASGGGAGENYLWDNGITTSSRLVYPSLNPLSTYSVTVTNAALCTSSLVKNINVLNNPTAGYSPEAANLPTVNGLLTFYDNSSTGSGQITNWNWSFLPNGNPAVRNYTSNQSASTSPAATGPMDVQLIVIDNNKCSDTVSNQYLIVEDGQCGISAVNCPNSICGNETVNLSANVILAPGQNSLTWFWDFGDGSTSSLPNPTHTYSGPGTYTISVYFIQQINSNDICTAPVFTKQITINPIPSGELFVDDTNHIYEICEGESFNLTINLNPSTSAYNVVVLGIGAINDIQSGYTTPLITQPPGDYSYTLQSMTNNNTGCSNPNVNSSVTITVDAKPLITVTKKLCKAQDQIWLADLEISKGKAPYTLTVTGMSPVTISTNTYNIVNIPVTTTSVVVSVLDANGCTYQVTIDKPSCDCPNPGPITMTPVVKNICEGTSKFSVSAVNGIVNTDNLAVLYELYDAQTNQVLSSVNLTQFNVGPEFTTPALGTFSYDKEYYVRATVARNNGSGFPDLTDACKLNTTGLNAKVHFRRNPRIAITFDVPEICAGSDAKVFFTPNYASNAVKVLWSKNGSFQETTFAGLDSFNLVGFTSDITVQILDIKDQVFGCESTNSDEATLKVNALPISTITAPPVCAGNNFIMTVGSVGNLYFWSKDGQVFPNPSETVQLTNADVSDFGVYSVTVVDGKGCSSISSVTVNSEDIQSNPTPNISGLIAPCLNQYDVIYHAHPFSSNKFTWQVTGGDVIYQAGDSISIHWLSAGVETLSVIEQTSAGCTGSQDFTVDVGAEPSPEIASVVYAPASHGLICTNNNFDCYQWGKSTHDTKNNITGIDVFENEVAQVIYFDKNFNPITDKNIWYWVDIWNSTTPCVSWNNASCPTRCYFKREYPKDQFVHPIDSLGGPIDSSAIVSSSLHLFPNPANTSLQISGLPLSSAETADVMIYRMDGRLIQYQKYAIIKGQEAIDIDMANLQSGLYILAIIDPKIGDVLRKTFVVQH